MSAEQEIGRTYPIRSVDRVCDILDTLANFNGHATLTDVVAATGLPKSSTFRYLSALESRRYVERSSEDGTYSLGLAFRPQHTLGIARLTQLARPLLEQLRDELGETTNLGVLDGTSVMHALVCESPQMMRLAAHVGDREQVHATALGKAIAATLPEDRLRTVIGATGMPAVTPYTITTAEAFLSELDLIRSRGYAIDEEENQIGGRCVAVSVRDLGFPAAVSVSAPATRFSKSDVPRVAKMLQDVADRIAARLGE